MSDRLNIDWDRKQKKAWANIQAHEALIKDKRRNLAYKKAIERIVGPNDIVLDIGCGTGIMSFFAAKKGCKKVYAVDYSDIIKHTEKLAKANQLENKVKCIKKDLFNLKLKEKADVLIHSSFGPFLWIDGHMPMVDYARKHLLKKGGKIIPGKIELYLAPVDYKSPYKKSISFWRRTQFGIDLSELANAYLMNNINYLKRPCPIDLNSKSTFLAQEKLAYSIDYKKDKLQVPRRLSASFKINRQAKLTGLVGYIKVYVGRIAILSCIPQKGDSTVGQMFIPFGEDKLVKKWTYLKCCVEPHRIIDRWKATFVEE